MKKILIVNAYSASNRGDAGIVVAMIKLLRRVWPTCDIKVMSGYPEANAFLYGRYGCASIPSVWRLDKRRTVVARYAEGFKIFALSVLSPRARSFAAFHDADVVISAGGGYLYSSAKGPLGAGLLCALCHYWLGYRAGKTVIGFPQSVGPISYTLDRLIIGVVLRRARLVISREEGTTSFLRQIGVRTVEIADIAFTLAPPERKIGLPVGARIGITVLDWRFSRRGTGEDAIDNYLQKMALILRGLLAIFPRSEIFIFPQVDVGPGDSDLPVSLRLEGIVGNERCRLFPVDDTCAPEALVAIYAGMDLFLASRMHSAIFSLAAGVPTIALAYQPKTTGTLSKVGLGEFVRDIEHFDAQELLEVSAALLRGEMQQELGGIDKIEERVVAELLSLVIDRPRLSGE